MNLNSLMKQAQNMQKDMLKAQEEVKKMKFEAEQALVKVEVNGDGKISSIKIDSNISQDDIEVLEDMILIATNEAITKAKEEMDKKLSKYGQGLSGLF